MAIIRIHTGPDGKSHFEDVVPRFEPRGDKSASAELIPGSGIVIRRFDANRSNPWHHAPGRAAVFTLSGAVDIEIGDGTVRRLGPGDGCLDDQGRGRRRRRDHADPRRDQPGLGIQPAARAEIEGSGEGDDGVELAPRLDGGVALGTSVDQAARARQLAPEGGERVEHRPVRGLRGAIQHASNLLHLRGLLRRKAVGELERPSHGAGPGVRDPQEAARRRRREAHEI